ncbi:hypothetical protein ACFY71_29220 [Streptomyces cinerochromogenes]|uniref:hypothetical protein n=1 Tax=Streptomyces cinerochromogenes TaxID=66422 RepID=UPI00368B3AE7
MGSVARGMVADGYRPDRYDVIGALVRLAGTAVARGQRGPRGTTLLSDRFVRPVAVRSTPLGLPHRLLSLARGAGPWAPPPPKGS